MEKIRKSSTRAFGTEVRTADWSDDWRVMAGVMTGKMTGEALGVMTGVCAPGDGY
jgi:hypothetical protein